MSEGKNSITLAQRLWLMYIIGGIEMSNHCAGGKDVMRAIIFKGLHMGIPRGYLKDLEAVAMGDDFIPGLPNSVVMRRAATFVAGSLQPLDLDYSG